MNKIVIFIVIFFTLVSVVGAREPTYFETYCLNTMFYIEKQLSPALPSGYQIVAIHLSPLGPKLVKGHYIRECWISRNNQVVAKIVLFEYSFFPNSILWDVIYTKIKLETEINGVKVLLGIGVLGENKSLIENLIGCINRINFEHLKLQD